MRFVQRTTQPDYIEFVPSTGCGSFLGKIGGRQEIFLAGGCSTGNTMHEIGHAIGFFHEQSRTDRDNSIIINWNNIQPNAVNNFRTYLDEGLPGFQLGTFDFGSIMLYSSFDFTSNGLPTITRLDGTTFFGQRSGLSNGDIETSDYIYGPPYAKVEYVNVVYENYSDFSSDYEHSEDDVYLRLYSDPQCTNPFITAIDRTFILKYIESGTQSNWESTPRITVPAGSNEVFLHTSLVTKDFYAIYGDVRREQYRRYEGRSVNFRTPWD